MPFQLPEDVGSPVTLEEVVVDDELLLVAVFDAASREDARDCVGMYEGVVASKFDEETIEHADTEGITKRKQDPVNCG